GSDAREEQSCDGGSLDGKGQHSAQMVDAVLAVFFIQKEDRFGVAVGSITMAAMFQLGTEMRIVVNFTIKNNPDGAVLIGHRLMPPGNINDAEPAERHRERS